MCKGGKNRPNLTFGDFYAIIKPSIKNIDEKGGFL